MMLKVAGQHLRLMWPSSCQCIPSQISSLTMNRDDRRRLDYALGRRKRPRTLRCRWCNSKIEIKPRGRVPEFCSQTCRQRAYEQRKWARPATVEMVARDLAQGSERRSVQGLGFCCGRWGWGSQPSRRRLQKSRANRHYGWSSRSRRKTPRARQRAGVVPVLPEEVVGQGGMRQLDRVVCAVNPRRYVGVQPLGCFTCPCRKLFGSHVSDIVLRQAPVSVEIDRPTTAHPPASIANGMRPRDLGAVHECKRCPRVVALPLVQIGRTLAEPTLPLWWAARRFRCRQCGQPPASSELLSGLTRHARRGA
jgi:hypothetical protein